MFEPRRPWTSFWLWCWLPRRRSPSLQGPSAASFDDASGAAIPGASITFTNQATGPRRRRISGPDGPLLRRAAGRHVLGRGHAEGFGKKTKRDLKVDAGGAVTAEFILEARLEEEITVTSMKREETIFDTPVSVAAPDRG